MLFVPLQFSVYPGPQTTSLSTQMHHMEDLVQFLSTLREGEERPIEFFNKQLSSAERNYAASEIECLAVVNGISNFAIHLLGRSFTVVTDHRALTALQTSRKLNGRLMQWALASTLCTEMEASTRMLMVSLDTGLSLSP